MLDEEQEDEVDETDETEDGVGDMILALQRPGKLADVLVDTDKSFD
jgi:hypothetical protein